MNTAYSSLSSNNTSTSSILPLVTLNDVTTLNVTLTGVSENFLPCFLKINWGDGNVDFFENDILLSLYSVESKYSNVLNRSYDHIYYPSISSTSQPLTATFEISYCNNDISTFIIPISVINYNYTQSIEDLKLVNTVSKFDKKIHQFVSKNNGYLIELETPHH